MTLEGLLKYPAVFLVAFAVTYLLVPYIKAIATRLGVVDEPCERRINDRTVPRAGGVAVFVGFHLACATIFLLPWSEFAGKLNFAWWLTFLSGSSLLLLVGLIDDAFNIKWSTKLLGQIAAALLMFQSGISVGSIQNIELPFAVDLIATTLWFLAFTNAFNLIDGLDGLATGLAAIAALGLAGTSILGAQPADALVLLGLLGACLAFLRFNFNPASIFLGDSGSMFLGFTLAAFAISTSNKGTTVATLGVPLLAMGVPVIDTGLAIWRRSVRAIIGRKENGSTRNGIMHPDTDHLHHRLLHAGFSQRRAAFFLYGLNVVLVLTGLLTMVYNSRSTGIFIIAFVLGSYVVVRHLARVELWDSGNAIVRGFRRPSSSVLAAILYPGFDALALFASLLMAALLSTSYIEMQSMKRMLLVSAPVWCGVPFICLILAGTYKRVWSRARIVEFLLLDLALLAGVLLSLGAWVVLGNESAKANVLLSTVLYFGFAAVTVTGLRLLPRALQDLMAVFDRSRAYDDFPPWNILVYGAGYRGILYLKHKSFSNSGSDRPLRILGFLDDERNLRGRVVHGYPVLGGIIDLPKIAATQTVHEVVIAATLPEEVKIKIVQFCKKRSVAVNEWIIEKKPLLAQRNLSAKSNDEEMIAVPLNDV